MKAAAYIDRAMDDSTPAGFWLLFVAANAICVVLMVFLLR